MFRRFLALVAVIGTLAYIGITHSAALITLIHDFIDGEDDSDSSDDQS